MGKGFKTFCFLKFSFKLDFVSHFYFLKIKIILKFYLFIYLFIILLFAKKSPQKNSNIWLFQRKAKGNK